MKTFWLREMTMSLKYLTFVKQLGRRTVQISQINSKPDFPHISSICSTINIHLIYIHFIYPIICPDIVILHNLGTIFKKSYRYPCLILIAILFCLGRKTNQASRWAEFQCYQFKKTSENSWLRSARFRFVYKRGATGGLH